MISTVEQIKEKLSIEEVISAYIKLQPAGQNLKAKCPFHGERTPSFMVSPARQTYHCFGCGVGGDMFSFIEAIEGVDFKGALKILADKAGVEIRYDKKSIEKKDKKEILFKIMKTATEFFEQNLVKRQEVREYLEGRGLKKDIIKEFKIGFAEDRWEDLLLYLKNQNYTEKDIELAGLIVKSEKKAGYYDRFRNRIMFPIFDSAGRVVAFSGRIFNISPDKEKTAKYINSPETLLFNKSKILYGYDKARQAIRRNNFAILVEGQMDLLASHQAGYRNTVAISGTALTDAHITLLSRMSKNLVLALDADDAGLASVAKSAKNALAKGFDVKVAKMPAGSDPADIISKNGGAEEWKNIIKNSKHVIDFLLDLYIDTISDVRKRKLVIEREVFPYIALIDSAVDKEHFIKNISARIGVSEEAIKNSIQTPVMDKSEVITSVMQNKEDSTAGVKERLVAIQVWTKDEKLESQLKDIIGKQEFDLLVQNIKKQEKLFFTLEELYSDDKKLKNDVENFLIRLRFDTLNEKLERATADVRSAEAAQDEEAVQKSLEKCNDLHQQLAKLS